MPQIIAGNHILIGAKSAAETVIFLLQIRCTELTSDGFVLCQLCFIHTLFAVEDIYGVRAEKQGDEVHIVFDGSKRTMDESIFKMLSAWADQSDKLRKGESSKDQYDRWRYTFPAEDTTQIWAKVPSKALSDMLVEAFKEDIK